MHVCDEGASEPDQNARSPEMRTSSFVFLESLRYLAATFGVHYCFLVQQKERRFVFPASVMSKRLIIKMPR